MRVFGLAVGWAFILLLLAFSAASMFFIGDAAAQVNPGVKDEGSPAIVIGFVGGFIKHDNPVHSEVQLAARLRQEYPRGVDVETFESYRGAKALQYILTVLDANHDGALTHEEKQQARIVLYGHSWGGAEAVEVARALDRENIPVLLTIQVDSIAKLHHHDALIPGNVARAANFYQPHGLLRGQSKIRAANPERTTIIGNFRFDYGGIPYSCEKYPWYDRLFVKPHTQIECDPAVWKQAEDLIRSDLAHNGAGDPRQ